MHHYNRLYLIYKNCFICQNKLYRINLETIVYILLRRVKWKFFNLLEIQKVVGILNNYRQANILDKYHFLQAKIPVLKQELWSSQIFYKLKEMIF